MCPKPLRRGQSLWMFGRCVQSSQVPFWICLLPWALFKELCPAAGFCAMAMHPHLVWSPRKSPNLYSSQPCELPTSVYSSSQCPYIFCTHLQCPFEVLSSSFLSKLLGRLWPPCQCREVILQCYWCGWVCMPGCSLQDHWLMSVKWQTNNKHTQTDIINSGTSALRPGESRQFPHIEGWLIPASTNSRKVRVLWYLSPALSSLLRWYCSARIWASRVEEMSGIYGIL